MTKRQSLATWLLCAALVCFGCDDDGGKGKGDAMDDAGPGGDGDLPGDGDQPGDGDNPGDGDQPGDGDNPGDGGGDGDAPVDTGSITGFVFDTQTPPQGVKDVLVEGPGGKTATTIDDGSFTLEDVAVGKDVVITTKDAGHTRALRNVGVLKGRTSYVDLVVKQVVSASFDPAKGGSVKGSDGSGATFSAGSLQTKDGGEPTGQVTVAVAAIDPTKSEDVKAFPGHAAGKNAENKSGLVESYVPMEVRVADGEGKDCQIKEGKNADFDFPVSANVADAPDEIDLWSLVESTGLWKFEGKAFKKRDDAGHFIYKAKIGHMSWWNAATFVDAITCVSACIKDEKGDPARGAQVTLTGQGSLFREVAVTGEDGCFLANLPQDSDVGVLAATATGVSTASVIHSGTTAGTWEEDPSSCKVLDPIDLTARPEQGACATGYTQCDNGEGGFYCADLNNDPYRCGDTCETAVYCGGGSQEGSGPYYSICVAGKCQCAPGWTECDGECINTKTDVYHCGACVPEQGCDVENDICNNGVCEKLVCTEPETECFGGRFGPTCTNTQTSRYNCGACGDRCGVSGELSDVLDPGYVCEAGVCGCEDGLTRCQPYKESPNFIQCFDTKTDNDNCGACGYENDLPNESAVCNLDSQICTNGVCTQVACANGQTACNRECVDTQIDNNNCGECHIGCGEGGKTCQAGECQCTSGTIECQGTCIDPMTNNTYCGGCPDGGAGIVCAGDQACVGGKCAQVLCLQNEAACGNHQCSDLLTDEQNCGGCGYICVTGDTQYPSTCTAGACACPAGQDVCGLPGYQSCQPTGMCPPILTKEPAP